MHTLKVPKRLLNQAGMTLTEVMVSVAIMGVLGTMGAQAYSAYSERSKYAASQATMSAIVSSVISLRVAEYKILSQLTGSKCTFCDQGFVNTGGAWAGLPAPALPAWKLIGFPTDPSAWQPPTPEAASLTPPTTTTPSSQ